MHLKGNSRATSSRQTACSVCSNSPMTRRS
jgi:hypothetical protein